ncbi:MAG: hypothetical protein AAF927_22005 [Bacteroidota bacterium]
MPNYQVQQISFAMSRMVFVSLIIVFLCTIFTACNPDKEVNQPTYLWGIQTKPLVIDSCFSPERFGIIGPRIIPPTEGKEIHKIAFDPLDDNALYITTYRRIVVGREVEETDSDLYRVELNNNAVSFVTSLTDLRSQDLVVNAKGDLLSPAQGEGFTIFNLNSLELKTENLASEFYPTNQSPYWISDSSFWLPAGLLDAEEQAYGALILYSDKGTIIDTFASRYLNILRRVSRSRNEAMILTSRDDERFTHSLYVYDQNQHAIVDSMAHPSLNDNRVIRGLASPHWLNDQQVLLQFTSLFMIADIKQQTYQLIPSQFSGRNWECRNLEIRSLQVVPNRPNEVLYVLNQFYYNELGEYRKRHDIIHLDIETGEENVLKIDF